MPRHVDLYLNGISLASAAPKVWIRQVSEEIPALDTVTAVFPGWDGERPIRVNRRRLNVTVTAQIHEVRDLMIRAAALDAIAGWVGEGGILTASWRPGKRLRVVPVSRPALGAVRDYTQEIKIELAAFAPPFWEDMTAARHEGEAGASGSIAFGMTGTAPAPVDVAAVPGGALTEFAVTAGGQTIALEGLSLAAGKELRISHTVDGFLTVTADGTPVLSARTAASADDLEILPGANTVTWTADAACAVTVLTRGRYL